MRILIVGLPKSGTTILTYRIAGALDDVHIDFEPPGGPDRAAHAARANVVTKKLVGDQTAGLGDYADYDRKIWISRDPRDFLVSQTLYRWHRETPPDNGDEAWFERILALVLQKETDPWSVPFRDLEPADYGPSFDAVAELWGRESDGGWLLFRYEDMIAGHYEELNRYLGFPVVPEASVAEGLERVVRRKGTGDWRDWFTPVDVAEYSAGALSRYMTVFGYDHDDWVLNEAPAIDPEHGSAYMTALFNDHRRCDQERGAALGPPAGPVELSEVAPEPGSRPGPRSSRPPVAGSVRTLSRRLLRRR